MRFLLTALLLAAFGAEVASAKIVREATCRLLHVEDTSAGSQRRLRAFIASDAPDGRWRIGTATSAARQIIKKTGYDFADVFVVPEDGPVARSLLSSTTASAWARFAPNPNLIPFMDAVWDVKAASAGPDSNGWFRHDIEKTTIEVRSGSWPEVPCSFPQLFYKLRR